MQHLNSDYREGGVDNEAATQDLLQLRTKKLDVGSEDIHRFSASCLRLGEYVHGNGVDQDWHLRCRNERRSLAALWLAARSDR